ncbi:hypothetical protein ACFE04_020009 [Oxalis oulophora]
MNNRVEEMFTEFYDKWISQLEVYNHQLMKVSKQTTTTTTTQVSDKEIEVLISNLTTHYKSYYTTKWGAAHQDVLAFYCPTWFTSLENAYSWVTDWKPFMVFKLVEPTTKLLGSSLSQLSSEQIQKIEELKVKIKLEEERVEREMERQQVGLAEKKMVKLARLVSQHGGDSVVEGLVGVAVKGLMGGLEKVMKAADCVRLKSLKGVLDVLNPNQCVEFLAAISMLQIQLRKTGKNREGRDGQIQ